MTTTTPTTTTTTTEKKKLRFIPGPNAGKPLPIAINPSNNATTNNNNNGNYSQSDEEDGCTRNDGRNVYIAGLTMNVKDDDLRSACEDYGTVLACEIMRDPHTGDSRGFAFVTMKTIQESDLLISALDGTLFDGKPLTCRLSRRGGPRRGTPGTYLGTRKERYYRTRAALAGRALSPYDVPPPSSSSYRYDRGGRDYPAVRYDDLYYRAAAAYAAYPPPPPPPIEYYVARPPLGSRVVL